MRPLLLCLALTACAVDRTTWEPEVEQAKVERKMFPAPTQLALDILIVVDRSPAMAAYPAVASELGRFLTQYATHPDPNWHVAVVSSDPRDRGVFRTEGLVGAPFLIDWTQFDRSRSFNYEGSLHTAIARLASAGTDGGTRTEPLTAITRALTDPRHAGFRRADAPLLIIVAAAVDDGSHADPVELAAEVKALVANPTDLHVTVIAPDHAPRLDAWRQAFPNRDQRASIAIEALSGWLAWPISTGWRPIVYDPCFEAPPADIDPLKPGVQIDCFVEEVLLDETRTTSTPLRSVPRCDLEPLARPCWRMVEDRANCPLAPGLLLRIDRREYATTGTHVIAECVTR